MKPIPSTPIAELTTNMNPNTFHALAFLSGSASDDQGRYVSDYLNFTPERWEECHNHIQWAFPSNIPSDFNKNAPVIDYTQFFNAITDVNGNLDNSESSNAVVTNIVTLLRAYMNSIGIKVDLDNNEIDIDDSLPLYLNPDHNHRRITRITLLINELDNVITEVDDSIVNEWHAFMDYMVDLASKFADSESPTDAEYWRVTRSFWL